MNKVNLAEKLSTFDEHWSPKIVPTMNEYDIQVVKVLGEFVWHNTMTRTTSSLSSVASSRSNA
jgi:hypothetical protein